MPNPAVYSAFDRLPEYVAALQAAPQADRRRLYRHYVLDPLWPACLAGAELETRARPMLEIPPPDVAWCVQAPPLVAAAELPARIDMALQQSQARLPGPLPTVGVFPLGSDDAFVNEHLHGVLGFAAGAGRVVLQVNPIDDWLRWIAYTVAHEYHHTVWRAHHPQYGDFSLLEYLVFEGRADNFAALVAPGLAPRWTTGLTPDVERRLWRQMQPHLANRERPQVLAFMVGNEAVPPSAGYIIGYRLVHAYLHRHRDTPVADWTVLAAAELLRTSGYDP